MPSVTHLSIRAVIAGILAALAVVLLRVGGILDGFVGLAFAVGLAMAAPWSRFLSLRLLFSGAVFLGWAPFAWWLPLDLGSVGKSGLLLAIITGFITTWVFMDKSPKSRARLLWPQLLPTDFLLLLAGVASVIASWPLLFSTEHVKTLALLLDGWDHVAHYGMFHAIVSGDAITTFLGKTADGFTWIGSNYPQHYHTAAAAVYELFRGNMYSPALAMLDYGRIVALLHGLTAVLLTAGVIQLPKLRNNLVAALPLSVLVLTVFLIGPGVLALRAGFPNFVLACATTALIIMLAITHVGKLNLSVLIAIGGYWLATVYSWVLLAPIAFGAIVIAAWRSKVEQCRINAVTAVCIVTAIATIAAWAILLSAEPLVLALAMHAESRLGSFIVVTSATASLALLLSSRLKHGILRSQLYIVFSVIVISTTILVGLAIYQLLLTGVLSYYFGKLVTGMMMLSTVMIAILASLYLDRFKVVFESHKRLMWAASLLLALGATQSFGYAGPLTKLATDKAIATEWISHHDKVIDYYGSAASRLITAANFVREREITSFAYLVTQPGDPHPTLANYWVHALTLKWTKKTDVFNRDYLNKVVVDTPNGLQNAINATQKILSDDKELIILVAPENLQIVRDHLPEDMRPRVMSWREPNEQPASD